MAYTRKKYDFGDSIEYEYTYAGRYGAKGEQREKKRKATPEQVAKQNLYNKKKAIRRLIKANFDQRDFWVTLKYPKGSRPPLDQVMKDWDRFIRKLKARYAKYGQELKWIRRIELGKRGGVHAHVIINRMEGRQTDLMIKECWSPGNINFCTIYGDFDQLADYLAKEEAPEEQLNLFDPPDKKRLKSYSHSRNLIKIEPQKRTYGHWTMRRILKNGPKPTKGYYIDKDSIRCGINPYTGMSYLYYTEIKIMEAINAEPEEKITQNDKITAKNDKKPAKNNAKRKKTARKERRSTDMEVKIFISSTIKSSTKKDGVIGYVIVMPTKKGDATLTDFEYAPEMTHNESEIYALNRALKRMTKPCNLEIYTDSAYLQRGLERIDDYVQSGWHKKDGEPVKFVEHWHKTASLLGEQPYNVHRKEENEYSGWLAQTADKLAEKMKEHKKQKEMNREGLETLVKQLKGKEF